MQSIAVAVGVLGDGRGRVLLAQRGQGSDFAGTWEFPGGKVGATETPQQALLRELWEELRVEAVACAPLLRIPWRYPHQRVCLHVFQVTDYRGEPRGAEGQALRWLPIPELDRREMPPADRPILAALRLPRHYAITPPRWHSPATLLQGLPQQLRWGMRLMQLRIKEGIHHQAAAEMQAAIDHCRAAGIQVLINSDTLALAPLRADGVHLTARALHECAHRPVPDEQWLAASCHHARDIEQAVAVGCDFITLSPVHVTTSHPELPALGWPCFASLCALSPLPTFALGGMHRERLDDARTHGAFGVAGISGFGF